MLIQFFTKIKRLGSVLLPRRRIGLVSLILLASLVLVIWFGLTGLAHAQTTDVNWFIEAITKLLMWVSQLFIKMTLWITSFVIEIAGYNGYVDSPAVTIGWVMVRDVTNMFFVVILLIIAFGTILGVEQYEWKKLLVKFIFAAIFVNFSRVIAGVFIDAAQVFMVTFVNGVAAVAGGNVLRMFNFEEMSDVLTKAKISGSGFFLAGVGSLVFSAIAMVTMGVYLFILLARMVALWVLIVLSPLAFVLSVIPQTQKYAGEWWQKFGSNVISGPVIVFFLWLAFVTVGTGSIAEHIAQESAVPDDHKIREGGALSADQYAMNPEAQSEQAAGISKAMTWAKMANFAIAIGMLLAGAHAAQQLGVAGGAAMSKAVDFGKKAAMFGSGYMVGRWAARKTGEGAKWAGKGVGGLALEATPFGDLYANTKDFFHRKREEIRNWRLEKAILRPSREHLQFKTKVEGQEEPQWLTEQQISQLRTGGKKVEKIEKHGKPITREGREKRNVLYTDEKTGHVLTTDNKRYKVEMDENGRAQYIEVDEGGRTLDNIGLSYEQVAGKAFLRDNKGRKARMGKDGKYHAIKDGGAEEEEATEVQRTEVPIMESQEEYERRRGWGLGRWTAYSVRRRASVQKKLKKTEDYQKTLEDLLISQTGGVPGTFWGGLTADRRGWVDGEDRMAQGRLKAEKARSAAKTEEFSALGEQATLMNLRFKDGKYSSEYPILARQIEEHKARAAVTQAQMKELSSAARNKFLLGKGKQVLAAKIQADLNVKTLDAEHKREESAEMLRYLKELPAGMEALKRRRMAEETTKRDEEAVKRLEGGAWRKLAGSEADLREQAEEDAVKEEERRQKLGLMAWNDAEKKAFIEQRTNDYVERARYGKTEAEIRAEAAAEADMLNLGGGWRDIYINEQVENAKKEGEKETGYGVLLEQQRLARRAKRADAIQKQIEAEAAQKFTEGGEGTRWAEAQRAAEVASKAAETKVGVVEEEAKKKVISKGGEAEAAEKKLHAAELAKKAAETEIKEHEKKGEMEAMREPGIGPAMVERINAAEQNLKKAEEGIKEIKNDLLGPEYKKAAVQLKAILDKGLNVEQLESILREGFFVDKAGKQVDVELSGYAKVMAQTAITAYKEQDATLQRKAAEDMSDNAFVQLPRLGTIKPSTVVAEFSESRRKEWTKMERLEAMEKGMQVLAKMFAVQDAGGKLDMFQQAELNTTIDFLSSEAWVDDKHAAMMEFFRRIQKKQAEAAERGNIYTMNAEENGMVARFSALGWLGKNEKGTITLQNSARRYSRKEARDMQALGSTGGDAELLEVHTKTEDNLEENERLVRTKQAKKRMQLVREVLARDEQDARSKAEANARAEGQAMGLQGDNLNNHVKQAGDEAVRLNTETTEVVEKEAVAAETEADSKNLQGEEREDYINSRISSAAERVNVKEFEKAISEIRREIGIDYWQAVKKALGRSGIGEMMTVDDVVERYRKHYDTLQQMARNGVKSGMNTGHAELMYNQGYDAEKKVIRFRTVREATTESWAERVKVRGQQQWDKDQYHTYGELDQETGMLDKLDIRMMATSLGKIEKQIDIRSMPDRTAHAYLLYHKDEQVETQTAKDEQGKEIRVMVLGGDKMRLKMSLEGDTTKKAQREHMLGYGVLRELLAKGGLGLGIISSGQAKHITEVQAKNGILNWDVGGKIVKTQADLIDLVLEMGKTEEGIKKLQETYLKGTDYEMDWDRARRELLIMRDTWRRKPPGKDGLSGGSDAEQVAAQSNPADTTTS